MGRAGPPAIYHRLVKAAWRHRKLAAVACLVIAVCACGGGVLVAQGTGGPIPEDPGVLQWAVGILVGIVMFLLGGVFGDLLSNRRFEALSQRLAEHEAAEGHATTIQRVSENGRDIKELKGALVRIEAKLDRVIERQVRS